MRQKIFYSPVALWAFKIDLLLADLTEMWSWYKSCEIYL